MKLDSENAMITVVVTRNQGIPSLIDTLTSSEEILEFELAMLNQESDPLLRVKEFRLKQVAEDEEFADFVEGLLSGPCVKTDVQEQAIKWFKSKAKIETYQKAEDEASQVIAQYALSIYSKDSDKTDFLLAGPKAKVRIRIVDLSMYQKQHVA